MSTFLSELPRKARMLIDLSTLHTEKLDKHFSELDRVAQPTAVLPGLVDQGLGVRLLYQRYRA